MSVDYLEHYGVLGMKWGVRRYQPYPKGDKKGVYLGDKTGHEPLKYKSMAFKKAGNYAKYAANYALAMIIPGYALAYNANSVRKNLKYNYDGKDYVRKDGAYEDLRRLTKKTSKTSPEEDAKLVNPGRRSGQVNNCGFCTVSMEMRRRGYDVKARRKGSGISTDDYANWFDGLRYESSRTEKKKGQSTRDWVNESYNKLCDSLEKKPNGARGFVAFQYRGQNSGHTLFWEVQNGNVTFYDAQSGKKNPGDVFSFSDQNYLYGRFDNCKLKPEVTTTCVSRDLKKRLKEENKK